MFKFNQRIIMEKLKQLIKYQYFQYPVLFFIITYIISYYKPDMDLITQLIISGKEIHEEIISKAIPFIPIEVGQYFMFLLIGFGYGTLSIFFQARNFRSIILVILVFITKVALVFNLLIPFFFLFFAETIILILAIYYLAIKKIVQFITRKIKGRNRLNLPSEIELDGNKVDNLNQS